MWPKVHLLKPDMDTDFLIHLRDGSSISLQEVRDYKNERTGLTGLTLVCEDSERLPSESWRDRSTGEIVNVNHMAGHEYKSNDADCSNRPGNYIQGVRMQYDTEEQGVKHLFPPFDIPLKAGGTKRILTGTSLGTMIFNFAFACISDFFESVRFEDILRYIPEIPGGTKDFHPNQ